MYQLPEEKLQPGMALAQPGATAVQEPPAAPLTDPAAFKVNPGPVGARYLAEPTPQPAPAQPAAVPAGQPADYWTDERKAFAKKINETAKRYGQMVQSRRQKRSAMKEYSKLKSQLDKEASMYSDLKEMQTQYGALFGVDANGEPNEHALAIQRQQAKHLQAASRLRGEVAKKAQQLSKQFGLPVNDRGDLLDGDDDQDDQQFDQTVSRGYMDALMYQPPQ